MILVATLVLIAIVWLCLSNSGTHQSSEPQIAAESLYVHICNLLQDNKTYESVLKKILTSIKLENYTHENEEIYWDEQIFPDLTFHAKKNYHQDDYSLYVFSNRRSTTKKYFGFSAYLSSPKCVEEQSNSLSMWIISADDSMLGCKAKRTAITLGKALCDVVNSHNLIANFSRNWQAPGF